MKAFDRSFNTTRLSSAMDDFPVIRELFKRWALPGEQDGSKKLRVAVRNGYLNLYVSGQSVAKIEVKRDGLCLSVHKKYLLTDAMKRSEEALKCGQGMTTLRGADLADLDLAQQVETWVSNAEFYCGAEKRFVDVLVSHNANVVDLEMALPGDDKMRNAKNRMVSPRMDLVTVQIDDDMPTLNFWEVKCANNSELRATAEIDLVKETGAPVAKQLNKYMRWLDFEGREDQVRCGFQRSAQVLLDLAEIFGKDLNSAACQCWKTLARSKPLIVRRPGIVIANYHPKPPSYAKRQEIRQYKHTFWEKHRKRLTDLGLAVIEIDNFLEATQPLPSLRDGPLGNGSLVS